MLGGVLAATLIPVIVDRMEAEDQRSIDAIATWVITALVVGHPPRRRPVAGHHPALRHLQDRPGRGRRPDLGRRAAAGHVHAPGAALRPRHPLHRPAERQALLRRPGLRPGAQQHRGHLRAAGLPADGGHRARPSTRSSTTRRCWCLLGLGTTAGIVALVVGAVAGHAARRHPHPRELRPPQPGRAVRGAPLGLDGRLRRGQPGLAVADEGPAQRHRRGAGLGVRVRLAVLPAPLRPVRGGGDDGVHARAVVAGGSRRLARLPGPHEPGLPPGAVRDHPGDASATSC